MSNNISVCGADCGECSYLKDKVCKGAALMNAGINVGGLWGDYASTLIHFIRA